MINLEIKVIYWLHATKCIFVTTALHKRLYFHTNLLVVTMMIFQGKICREAEYICAITVSILWKEIGAVVKTSWKGQREMLKIKVKKARSLDLNYALLHLKFAHQKADQTDFNCDELRFFYKKLQQKHIHRFSLLGKHKKSATPNTTKQYFSSPFIFHFIFAFFLPQLFYAHN